MSSFELCYGYILTMEYNIYFFNFDIRNIKKNEFIIVLFRLGNSPMRALTRRIRRRRSLSRFRNRDLAGGLKRWIEKMRRKGRRLMAYAALIWLLFMDYEGIRRIERRPSKFAWLAGPDNLCMHIVTWNMNGKVHKSIYSHSLRPLYFLKLHWLT